MSVQIATARPPHQAQVPRPLLPLKHLSTGLARTWLCLCLPSTCQGTYLALRLSSCCSFWKSSLRSSSSSFCLHLPILQSSSHPKLRTSPSSTSRLTSRSTSPHRLTSSRSLQLQVPTSSPLPPPRDIDSILATCIIRHWCEGKAACPEDGRIVLWCDLAWETTRERESTVSIRDANTCSIDEQHLRRSPLWQSCQHPIRVHCTA